MTDCMLYYIFGIWRPLVNNKSSERCLEMWQRRNSSPNKSNPRNYGDNSAARWLRENLQRRGAFVSPGFGSWERVARADRSARGTATLSFLFTDYNTCRRVSLAIRSIWPVSISVFNSSSVAYRRAGGAGEAAFVEIAACLKGDDAK